MFEIFKFFFQVNLKHRKISFQMISDGENYYSLHSDISDREIKISTAHKINYFSLNPCSRCQPVTVLQATTILINLSIVQSLRSITIHI